MKSINRSTASLFTTSKSNPNVKEPAINKAETQDKNVAERVKSLKSFMSRRSFLGTSLAVGAGTIGAGLLANAPTARASGGLTAGDEAILRLLAAAEIIETDLWQQYNTTNSPASKTAKFQGELGTRPIPPPWKCWMRT